MTRQTQSSVEVKDLAKNGKMSDKHVPVLIFLLDPNNSSSDNWISVRDPPFCPRFRHRHSFCHMYVLVIVTTLWGSGLANDQAAVRVSLVISFFCIGERNFVIDTNSFLYSLALMKMLSFNFFVKVDSLSLVVSCCWTHQLPSKLYIKLTWDLLSPWTRT